MSKAITLGAMALLGTLAAILWQSGAPRAPEPQVEIKAAPPQPAPPCPWRDPKTDLARFFPDATAYEAQTRILSGRRLELAERLGRTPAGDENTLQLYRVQNGTTPLGTILTRRVRGEFGAIELVLAVDGEQRVCGLFLQRLREPEPVARALQDPAWLGSFAGKRAGSAWEIGRDIPEVPVAARASAGAVVEGARSLLILLAVAQPTGSPGTAAHLHY
jgi:hypothetical protein